MGLGARRGIRQQRCRTQDTADGLFLGGIVGLDRLGLDDDGSVAFLPCFRTGCDRAGDVAGREDDGTEGHQEDGEDSGDGASDSEDGGDGEDAVSDSIRHNRR